MDTHMLKSSQGINYLYGRDKTQNLPTTIFSLWSFFRRVIRYVAGWCHLQNEYTFECLIETCRSLRIQKIERSWVGKTDPCGTSMV